MITEKSQQRRIQALRGLAIVAVVAIHNTPLGMAQVLVRPFLNFSVGLFLFLSGMLSDAQHWNPGKRVVKVGVPYILWTLIYCVLSRIDDPLSIPAAVVKGLVAGRSAAMMYYIPVYIQFTLLIPVIDRLARSKFKYLFFLVTPLEIVFMQLIPLMTNWYGINYYIGLIQGVSCLGWFTYFYLGYLMGNRLIEVKGSLLQWGGFLAVSILLQIVEGYWLFTKGIINCGTQQKLSAIFSGACFVVLAWHFICGKKERNFRVLELLGDHSFGIYFSHIAVMAVMRRVPLYNEFVIYPLNVAVVVVVNLVLIRVGRRILGKYGKYLAL